MTTWFTSDLHFSHQAILRFCPVSRPFKDVDEMNSAIIERWNNKVKEGDTVYVLGDFSFDKNPEVHFHQLKGRKKLITGNHDANRKSTMALPWDSIHDLYTVSENGLRAVLCHFPLEVWNQAHHGYLHFHGHCFDYETEVLTIDGWKRRNDISLSDSVATLNMVSLAIEYQNPTEIIDAETDGEVMVMNSRNVNMRVASEHSLVVYDKDDGPLRIEARYFADKSKRVIPLSGTSMFPDLPLSDDELRLLIWVATDGSLENSSLIRFHLRKQRKIDRLRALLGRLGIAYSDNKQLSGTTKINLSRPSFLDDWSLKPLDWRILKSSQRQAAIIIEEYLNTDGNWQGGTSFQISTGKKYEADLLQAFMATHGYTCIMTKRLSFGGKYTVYCLSGNTKRTWSTSTPKKHLVTEKSFGEKMWCLSVPNKTLVTRRCGKVHITGNSHGGGRKIGRRFDVGFDVFPDGPVSFQELGEMAAKEKYEPVDHHGAD